MNHPPNGQPRRTHRANQTETPGPVSGPAQPGRIAQPPTLPSLEVLQAQFEATMAANETRFAELAAEGIAPDPFFLVHARINHLIDQIASATGPNGPRWAALTRLGFEQYIAAELSQASRAAQRLQLAEGARYTPRMIAELARQTGTFRRPQ